jgi:hypothetical protein
MTRRQRLWQASGMKHQWCNANRSRSENDKLVSRYLRLKTRPLLGSGLSATNSPLLGRALSTLIGVGALASVFATHVRAEGTLATLSWQNYDDKDALTQKVDHQVISEATFASGTLLQTTAKCGPTVEDKRYPGVVILVTTFKKSGTEANPFAWRDNRVAFPVLMNEHPLKDRARSVVTTYSDNPRANILPIGFYDPVAGERYALGNQPAMMKLQALSAIAEIERSKKMDEFIADTGGTLPDLLQATSFRVQLLLADGTTNAIEINPQDPILKAFAQRCSSQIQRNGAQRAN